MLTNFICQLRNSQMANHSFFSFIDTTLINNILSLLWDEGFIKGFRKDHKGKVLIFLLYSQGLPLINRILLISRPNCRIYASCLNLYKLSCCLSSSGGVFVVSTSKGLMLLDQAVSMGLGGELLLYIE